MGKSMIYNLRVLPAESIQKSARRRKFRYSLDPEVWDYLEQAMQSRIRKQIWKLIHFKKIIN
jgi:hypothetical protein